MTYLIPGRSTLFLEQQIMLLLADYFSLERRKVTLDSRLVDDLYVDSLNVVEIAILLNETFSIELPAERVARWRTVADICGLVRNTCK